MTMRIVGIDGRNDTEWFEPDYEVVRMVNPGVLKMMSHTNIGVFERLRRENPEVKFITRLYDGGNFGEDHRHPTPADFAGRMFPVIESLLPFCDTFQIHNEPNHQDGIEGWGKSEADANNFTGWFMLAYNILKSRFPDCSFGFPGLAIPQEAHNDLTWLGVCKPAIEKADWLGCHCYWQNRTEQSTNHLDGNWGLRFVQYHDLFPQKDIHILEGGNSNCHASQNDKLAGFFSEDPHRIAAEAVQWYEHCAKYEYVKSASWYLLSSPDPSWSGFVMREENGRIRPIVDAMAQSQFNNKD